MYQWHLSRIVFYDWHVIALYWEHLLDKVLETLYCGIYSYRCVQHNDHKPCIGLAGSSHLCGDTVTVSVDWPVRCAECVRRTGLEVLAGGSSSNSKRTAVRSNGRRQAGQPLYSQNLVQLAAAAAAIIPLIRWTSSRMLSYNQIQTSVAPRRADLDERESVIGATTGSPIVARAHKSFQLLETMRPLEAIS